MSPELQAAVARHLSARGAGGYRVGAAALTQRYRAGERSDAAIDLGAYLVARLPATFAAVKAVLCEIALRRPGFAPGGLLDVGCGPGTASWAAVETWPELRSSIFLDDHPGFLALAGQLARGASHPALVKAKALQGDMIALLRQQEVSDLVICAYALAEIPEGRLTAAVESLWQAARDILVLVEPGTPAGFRRLHAARSWLLASGAVPVAPCPHGGPCPLVAPDWCHFPVRLARSRAHMHAKAAAVPFEDEKFSYLAVSRHGAASGGARIVAPPGDTKPGLTFKLCTEAGLETRHVARRDREAYKTHRKAIWGGLLGPGEGPT
ncbi:MAG: methyltransferase domain-containing protein [Alphaproteobacteria bacterium]|nr:methyltransferase domain-containing protein [Alphaproteobacteria bacterium]